MPKANQNIARNDASAVIEFEGRLYEVSFVRMTPEAARALLETKSFNRTLSRTSVSILKSRIDHDNFLLTGETIIIDQDGKLIDGQHRLHAIVESGKSAPLIIIFGVERRAYAVIDTGSKRTVGTMLAATGMRNGKAMASTCNIIRLLRSGWTGTESKVPLSVEEVQEMIYEEEAIGQAVDDVESWLRAARIKRSNVSHSTIAGVYAACREANEPVVDDLFRCICTGTGLELGTTALLMRQALLQGGRSSDQRRELAALLVNGVKRILAGDIHSRMTPKGTVQGRFPELPKRKVRAVAAEAS